MRSTVSTCEPDGDSAYQRSRGGSPSSSGGASSSPATPRARTGSGEPTFGRSDLTGRGFRHFKASWEAVERPLAYFDRRRRRTDPPRIGDRQGRGADPLCPACSRAPRSARWGRESAPRWRPAGALANPSRSENASVPVAVPRWPPVPGAARLVARTTHDLTRPARRAPRAPRL